MDGTLQQILAEREELRVQLGMALDQLETTRRDLLAAQHHIDGLIERPSEQRAEPYR